MARSTKPVTPTKTTRDYAATGWAYARQVIEGDLPASQWTRKACKRSLTDLEALPGYRFDAIKGNKVAAFVERLSHVKGKLGGQLIRLEPWQCWVLTQAFGWVHDGGDRDGYRRFRTVYLELGRGNGKSCLSSAVALYLLTADGEHGAEVYSCATSAEQARIVFRDAQAMAKAPASAKLMNLLGVAVNAHTITVEGRNSVYKATSSEYSTMDGYNVHGAILDELHAYPDRGLWDVIVTGAGKRPQSMIWGITTSGTNRTGICYEQRTYLTKILDKVAEDPTMFGCIWCADDDDFWVSEITWQKANPNWGISIEPTYITALANKAREMPAAQATFRTKHLCQWVSSDHAWLDMLAVQKCFDENLSVGDFWNDPCWIGLDLASKVDLAAKIRLFKREINGQTHFYSFGEYYLPESAADQARNSQYPGWKLTGLLTTTPGDVIDFDQIEQELKDDAVAFNVQEIAYDPWQAMQLATHMMAEGANMIEVRPNVQNFSPAMKELEGLIKGGRFHFNDPVLSWCLSNVVCKIDANDNVFPRKEREENKIDGAVALLTALVRAMAHQPQEEGIMLAFI